MPRLLIIADDFTGALDTGVQFAACGIPTRVVVGTAADMIRCECTVLVVDTETRHLSAEAAGKIVEVLARRAREAGVSCLYKKTDSALRGNIGAELSALLRASGERQLPFLPAYPQIGRTTKRGIHYINGVPVDQSPFGQDPFEPVLSARVAELIRRQTDCPVASLAPLTGDGPLPEADGILIFDAASPEQLLSTGQQLFRGRVPPVLAGCAGFAAFLPGLLQLPEDPDRCAPRLEPRLLVLCGSVNPITLRQMDRAEQAGFARLRLTPRQKLESGYWESEDGQAALAGIEAMLASNARCIIETNDAGGNQLTAQYAADHGIDLDGIRVGIASSVGSMFGTLFQSASLGTLLLTGGDTLLQCMNCVGVRELEPVCELEKGVVLAKFTYRGCTRYVITKSGGFGQEDLLVKLAERIVRT